MLFRSGPCRRCWTQLFPWPRTTSSSLTAGDGFQAIAGFPNIIGAIDCTHIATKAPSTNEFNYVNRKGFHSVNVQIVCDANLSLLNVERWPGGTHDSFIMQNSSVGVRLHEGAVEDGWLIGEY